VHGGGSAAADTHDLSQMGVANTANMLTGTAGCLLGGWFVSRTQHWHRLAAGMQIWVGVGLGHILARIVALYHCSSTSCHIH
jgi:hypothetical protein